VAVDLENPDCSAVAFAYSLARRGDEVHLAHVLLTPSLPSPLYAHYSREHFPTEQERRELVRRAEARLRFLAQAQRPSPGVSTRVHVVESHAVQSALVELVGSVDADLVCVLARRRVGPGRCGRLVRRLLASSRKPVLIVRPGSGPAPARPERGRGASVADAARRAVRRVVELPRSVRAPDGAREGPRRRRAPP